MRNTLVGVVAAGVAASLPGVAAAQSAATVKEIERVVKTGRSGSPSLTNAKVGMPLGVGDRVRTGGRSGAGLRFQDQSLLRIGELTEIVVTSGRQRQARVERGKVFADYKTPGTISGGYAVAAVRGTHVLYDRGHDEDLVRCYKGRVFVSSIDNPLSAGAAQTLTATTLMDPALIDSPTDWVGGEVRFTDGPYAGQARRITAFDRATGAVTFEPALVPAPAGDAVNGYLLVRNPSRRVVELHDNEGTTVKKGEDPSVPYGVASEEFAQGEQYPWFHNTRSLLLVYNGTEAHWRDQDENWASRDALRRIEGRMEPCDCGGRPLPPGGFGGLSLRSPAPRASRMRTALALQEGAGGTQTGGSPRLEDIYLPQNVRAMPDERKEQVGVLLEPFAYSGEERNGVGARVRLQGTSGDAYAELGYRYLLMDGSHNHNDVSEGFVHLRGHSGDLIAGRQHLFIGPANNNDIATLLGLESTDAIVYDLPLKGGYQQRVGYLFDSRAMGHRGFHGGFARGMAPLRGGNVGYSILAPSQSGNTVGFSGDISQPIIPNVLDAYGEIGKGVGGHTIILGGLYVPALYHAFKTDLFIEYAKREDVREDLTFRLRRELGNGLNAQVFADREAGEGWDAGGGFVWSLRFR